MPRALITLTTDFGLSDHFVGTMKGVILGIAPQARIVDITHGIQPFEIAEAGYVIAQAYRYFPSRTVHVIVVDPGVGGERRPILAEAAGQYFIAPDNGVLSTIYALEKHKVRHITARRYMLKELSRTFHGRDVFAPAAAHLAKGAAPASFGKLIHDYARSDVLTPRRLARRVWSGTVLHIDRFGNLITNFSIEEFRDVRKWPFELRVGLECIHRLASSYADAQPGELFVVVGSSGCLEVSLNQGSAAKKLGCVAGAPAELELIY